MKRWGNLRASVRASSLVAGGALLLACSSQKASYDLLKDEEAIPETGIAEEQRRLQEMQLITVETAPGVIERKTARELQLVIVEQCLGDASLRFLGEANAQCSTESTTDCTEAICHVQTRLCQAHLKLELASIRAEPLILANGWKIYAQSNAANAAFARESRDAAEGALKRGARALYDASVNNTPMGSGCGNASADGTITYTLPSGAQQTERRAVTLARGFVESVNLFRESTESLVRSTLAVSDAELNSGPRTVGIDRAISNLDLSRVAAARALVGGGVLYLDDDLSYVRHGFPGYVAGRLNIPSLPKGGFCSEPELTSQAQSALSVLREAAPAPDAILDEDITISQLLDDTGSAVVDADNEPVGSVRQRLSDLWGNLTDAPIVTQFNLETEDFVQARRFMAQELLAFSRSRSTKEKRRKADGTFATYYAYGATASAPEQPPDAYYGALARFDIRSRSFRNQEGQLPYAFDVAFRTEGLLPNLADGLDHAISFAGAIASHRSGFYTGSTWNDIKPLIGLVASMSDRPGRLGLCAMTSNSTQVAAQGYSATDKLLLVKGEDGLNCGVKGKIEGMACSMQDHAVVVLNGDQGTPRGGFTTVADATWNAVPAADTRYYLLKPKLGAPSPVTCDPEGDSCIEGVYPSGSYDALVGVTVPKNVTSDSPGVPESGILPQSGFPWCLESPIVPEMERRAALVLAPNKDMCARSRITCADASFDQRLPLENELSDDNDNVESSWRRYLALARQAADEADLLGEQYIQHGLDVDYRDEEVSVREEQKRQLVETLVEELQATCGTSMDTSTLFGYLSGQSGDDLANFTLDDCPCSSGYKCINNVCIVDLTATVKALGNDGDPDIMRLAECLDPGGTEKLIHLGEKAATVCAWRGTGVSANELCKLPCDPANPLEDCDCDPTKPGDQKCLREEHPCPALPEVSRTPPIAYTSIRRPAATGSGSPALAEACKSIGACSASELNCKNALGFGAFSNTELEELGVDIEPATVGLGYFPLESASNQTSRNFCETIRRNSTFPGSDMDGLQALIKSNVLHPTLVYETAGRIGFEARLGGYAAITVDGVPRFDTGSPWSAMLPTDWPCGDKAAFAECADGSNGLFCDLAQSCTNASERAIINARFLRAVIAVRWISDRMDIVTSKYTESVDGETYHLKDGINAEHGVGGIILPYYGRYGNPSVSTRLLAISDNLPIHVGKYINPAKWPPVREVSLVAKYIGDTLPITPYYDENGTALALEPPVDFHDYFATYPGYSFIEMGLPYARDTDDMGPLQGATWGRTALRGLSQDGSFWYTQHDHTFYKFLVGEGALEPLRNEAFMFPPKLCRGEHSDGDNHIYPAFPDPLNPGKLFSFSTCDEAFAPIPMGQVTFSFQPEAMLDGLELLCHVSADPRKCDLTAPPAIRDIGDLNKSSSFLRCAADSIRSRSALTLFSNVPKRAVDALRAASVVGSHPATGGEIGDAVSIIRSGLVAVARVAPLIANELEQFGTDMEVIHGVLAQSQIRSNIADLQFMSQTADRMAECATVDVSTFGFNNMVRCANAVGQIQFASEINELVKDEEKIASELAMHDFRGKFSDRATNMQGYALELVGAIENVDQGLIAFEAARQKAERVVGRILYAASFHAKNEVEITSVLQQRKRTDQKRYQQAHQNAVRMAFLAKRAIELRLGVHLSNLTEKLPLVPAPSEWESTLCTSTGVNYDRLRKEVPGAPEDYADAYIGDYVTKLENLIESYRLEFGFHEGQDVAVASLRDDVLNIRKDCDVPSDNLLYHAGQLDGAIASDTEIQGQWRVSGCRKDAEDVALPDCVSALPLETAAFSSGLPGVGTARAYEVSFGEDGEYCSGAETCGFQAGAALVQSVTLQPGRYRFSWYENAPLPAQSHWVVRDASGEITSTQGTTIAAANGNWARLFVTFDIDKAKVVSVGFKQPASGVDSISVSGPMLEALEHLQFDVTPGVFVNTGSTLVNRLPACQDTDGSVFRATSWKRNCEMLCRDGFSSDCSGGAAKKHCYREAKFSINQRAIEAGDMFNSAGFARGNFNYRLDSIALNFVGTSTRDCANSPTPSTCYAAGYIPYSLQHLGPYYVRNHMGQDFRAHLFTGKIEHARGLATERYLTNPLSSTDRELLTDYLRTELRGRPLDGNFIIRVWEEEGVNFDAIEDVQILIKYGYWTRFE